MWCWLLHWKYINTFLNVKVHVKPWVLILSFTKYHIFYNTYFSSVLYWHKIPGTLFRISVAVIFCYLGLPKMCTGVLLASLLLSGVDMTGAWYRREYGGGYPSIFPPSIHPVWFCPTLRPLSEAEKLGGWVPLFPVAMTPGLSHLDVVCGWNLR